jgi:tRNA threonylcarbamoyladenosine biosynthesis protein TsaE
MYKTPLQPVSGPDSLKPVIYTCADLDEFKTVAREIARTLKPGSLITLSGTLGAGKTTLVTQILEYWGFATAGSPTFNLRNDYRGSGFRALHLDFYRLKPGDPGFDLLPPDEDYADAIVLAEWPEKADPQIFAPFAQKGYIVIEVQNDGKRAVTYEVAR